MTSEEKIKDRLFEKIVNGILNPVKGPGFPGSSDVDSIKLEPDELNVYAKYAYGFISKRLIDHEYCYEKLSAYFWPLLTQYSSEDDSIECAYIQLYEDRDTNFVIFGDLVCRYQTDMERKEIHKSRRKNK